MFFGFEAYEGDTVPSFLCKKELGIEFMFPGTSAQVEDFSVGVAIDHGV